MVRKIVLIKSVIASLLVYTMQVNLILAITIQDIKRYQKAFIWGHDIKERKIHTISWDKFCQPKK